MADDSFNAFLEESLSDDDSPVNTQKYKFWLNKDKAKVNDSLSDTGASWLKKNNTSVNLDEGVSEDEDVQESEFTRLRREERGSLVHEANELHETDELHETSERSATPSMDDNEYVNKSYDSEDAHGRRYRNDMQTDSEISGDESSVLITSDDDLIGESKPLHSERSDDDDNNSDDHQRDNAGYSNVTSNKAAIMRDSLEDLSTGLIQEPSAELDTSKLTTQSDRHNDSNTDEEAAGCGIPVDQSYLHSTVHDDPKYSADLTAYEAHLRRASMDDVNDDDDDDDHADVAESGETNRFYDSLETSGPNSTTRTGTPGWGGDSAVGIGQNMLHSISEGVIGGSQDTGADILLSDDEENSETNSNNVAGLSASIAAVQPATSLLSKVNLMDTVLDSSIDVNQFKPYESPQHSPKVTSSDANSVLDNDPSNISALSNELDSVSPLSRSQERKHLSFEARKNTPSFFDLHPKSQSDEDVEPSYIRQSNSPTDNYAGELIRSNDRSVGGVSSSVKKSSSDIHNRLTESWRMRLENLQVERERREQERQLLRKNRSVAGRPRPMWGSATQPTLEDYHDSYLNNSYQRQELLDADQKRSRTTEYESKSSIAAVSDGMTAAEWRMRFEAEAERVSKLKEEVSVQKDESKKASEQAKAMAEDSRREMFVVSAQMKELQSSIVVSKFDDIDDDKDTHTHRVRRRPVDSDTVTGEGQECEVNDVVSDDEQFVRLPLSQLKSIRDNVKEQETLIDGYQRENERLVTVTREESQSHLAAQRTLFSRIERLEVDLSSARNLLERRCETDKSVGAFTNPRIRELENDVALGLQRENDASLNIQQLENKLKEVIEQASVDVSEASKRAVVETMEAAKHSADVAMDEFLLKKDKWEKEKDTLLSETRREVSAANATRRATAAMAKRYESEAVKLRQKVAELERVQRSKTATSTTTGSTAKQLLRIRSLEKEVRHLQDELQTYQLKSARLAKNLQHDDRQQVAVQLENDLNQMHSEKKEALDRCERLEVQLEAREKAAAAGIENLREKFSAMRTRYEDRVAALEATMVTRDTEHSETVGAVSARLCELERELAAIRAVHRRILDGRKTCASASKAPPKKRIESATVPRSGIPRPAGKSSYQEGIRGDGSDVPTEIVKRENDEISALDSKLQRIDFELDHESRILQKLGSIESENDICDMDRGIQPPIKEPKPQDDHVDLSNCGAPLMKGLKLQDDQVSVSYRDDVSDQNLWREVMRLQDALTTSQTKMEGMESQSLIAVTRAHTEAKSLIISLKETHARELAEVKSRTSNLLTDASLREEVETLRERCKSLEILVKMLNEKLLTAHREATAAESGDNGKPSREELKAKLLATTAELEEARRHQSPAMSHFKELASRLHDMEARQRERETTLKNITLQVRESADMELASAQRQFEIAMDSKDAEIAMFRRELDELLAALHNLQNGATMDKNTSYNAQNHRTIV